MKGSQEENIHMFPYTKTPTDCWLWTRKLVAKGQVPIEASELRPQEPQRKQHLGIWFYTSEPGPGSLQLLCCTYSSEVFFLSFFIVDRPALLPHFARRFQEPPALHTPVALPRPPGFSLLKSDKGTAPVLLKPGQKLSL